ncbi:MAG: SUF system NifU family Fe-S cluster assembly protein [Lentisphaerae bacterium]|nr:SUF system NifU family Fe-S cluster assembly protein [Lentisphaerota bacterium]
MTVSDELYQQVILDHNRSPRNMRALANATHQAQGINPLCGDEYTVYLAVDAGGIIREVTYEGHGCAISKASASMMSQALAGKTIAEAHGLFDAFHALVLGKAEAATPPCELGKLKVFSGVWRYPARVKCAALSWHAMKSALDGQGKTSTEDAL